MTAEPLSFFTIDHGTATTAASLIAPVGGRFRLLAFGAAPAGVDPEAILEDLVARVVAIDAGALPRPEGWEEWARLESETRRPLSAVCVAATPRRLADLEHAVAGAGWEIRGRLTVGQDDRRALAERCLEPDVRTVLVGCGESPDGDERKALPEVCAVVGAIAARRPELQIALTGGATEWGAAVPRHQLTGMPGPTGVATSADSPLRDAAARLALGLSPSRGAPPLPDGREALRISVTTLARLLDRRVEAVDVGHAAGSRTLAHPSGTVGHLVCAEGALVPATAMRDDDAVDAMLLWSALRADPFTMLDRVRNLRLAPWRDAAGDGARLRLSMIRAALARIEAAWGSPVGRDGQPMPAAADVLVACGGAFSAVPPAGAALALIDTLRRPGAMAVFHDHARLLGPIGVLADESDRRRLIADLLDDALLPLGSAVVAGGARPSRYPRTVRVTSALRETTTELAPGSLRQVDLPPGMQARVEIESREGTLLGVRSRHVVLEVTGGLGGLLVDMREVPLRLPDRPERRRALFESWERPVWASSGQ